MEYHVAKYYADALVEQMRPCCERVEIAGSLRREKPEVKDIEIVCIPRVVQRESSTGLFGDPHIFTENLLFQWAIGRMHGVYWIKPGTSEIVAWLPKEDGKYWRGLIDGKIKLDLFLATPRNFGAIFLIRTGSADFSQAVVTRAKQQGKPCVDGFFTLHGVPIETPEEDDVFRHLGLQYVPPIHRHDGRCLRAIKPVEATPHV